MSKMIIKKPVIGCSEWSVLKYKREVFFQNLWDTDAELLESRGKVVDSEGNTIALPLKKVFNFLENGAGSELTQDSLVEVTQKINGSMLHVTATDKGLLFGTTGSAVLGDATTDNDFLNRGREAFYAHIDEKAFINHSQGKTVIFEVVDSVNDPHVVEEEDGLYLLASRKLTGELDSNTSVEILGAMLRFKSGLVGKKLVKVPLSKVLAFGHVLDAIKECRGEGYMIRLWNSGEVICKLKSPYYLNRKKAQRIKPELLFANDWRSYFDDDFYATVNEIRRMFTKDQWSEMDEQERSKTFDHTYKTLLNIKLVTDA